MGPSLTQRKRCVGMIWERVRTWGDLGGVQMRRILGKKRRVFLISALFGLALLIAMVWIARPMAVLAPFVFLGFTYGRLLSIGELLLFFALSTVFSLFSCLTPGGIGVMEGAYAAVFGIMGLPIDGAIAFSLLQKLSSLCIIGVGIIYLSHRGVDLVAKRKQQ